MTRLRGMTLGLGMLGLTGLLPCSLSAAPATSGGATGLVLQLGDRSFAVREEAERALLEMGKPALDALTAASSDENLEIRRRAERIRDKIIRQLRDEAILAPTLVELTLKDVSINEAVAALKQQTGYSIVLQGSAIRLTERNVTLSTGRVPFWEALERLCEKCDLMEVLPSNSATQPLDSRSAIRRSQTSIRRVSETITLKDRGTDRQARAIVVGACRLRPVMVQRGLLNADAKPTDQVIGIDIRVEPKLALQRLLGLAIFQATDDHGETMATDVVQDPAVAAASGTDNVIIVQNGVQMQIQSSSFRRVAPGLNMNPLLLRLSDDGKTAKQLQQIRGEMAFEIRAAAAELAVIDNLLNTPKAVIRDTPGVTLQSKDVSRIDAKTMQFELEVSYTTAIQPANKPRPAPLVAPNDPAVPPNAGVRRIFGSGNTLGITGLELTDDKGNPIVASVRQSRSMHNGREVVQSLTIHAQIPEGNTSPVRVSFSGSAPTEVTMPFRLTDVRITP
ncbi:Uncharacterized protein OS=Isosphaera pallida (strain ATCC 43644 / DSM 9630 / IS1B) GN=Isop_3204 PE=4 SV=1 [Tuwongella immobilis]|uniref:NolW-like domain-containing protein n=2 Tax=Tuwongella immobilis TaxID=692036 RepID=A0A6C2YIW7_9BACT|nr:Uncharacterized protein OS=Isosphaera pallida (strain ATCC 43644 / DSM 9630 / IS1B) GN=Isop_3204 PE=4 SV=1 [Tuwongella immobilis]VTR98161.1 Uncharacterized protein OS=Isosphaera pallida (strain ATCC 43644 / DSM 9630 / IS1B) GN=Isop_3204 PE=4 SV=1 [Tuwongella immobilis]